MTLTDLPECMRGEELRNERLPFLKLSPDGFGNPIVIPASDAGNIAEYMDGSEEDDRWSIFLFKMTPAEYLELPEHEGF